MSNEIKTLHNVFFIFISVQFPEYNSKKVAGKKNTKGNFFKE